MKTKHLILSSILGLSVGLGGMAYANPVQNKVEEKPGKAAHCQCPKQSQHHHPHARMITPQQKMELHKMVKNMHQQINPLMKEITALRLQLNGKMATPGTQWRDIAGLVNAMNAKQAQINIIKTKAQMEVFQKLGVLFPPNAVGHHHPMKRIN